MASNNKTVDWTKLKSAVEKKYKNKTLNSDVFFREEFLNIESLDWITHEATTKAYGVFVDNVNRIELAINLFENLLLFEDIRYENNGIGDFVIDIPRNYFRFPLLNNSRNPRTYRDMNTLEEQKIESIILESRNAMNLRNDENIVREHFHRLEFLTIFSCFEAFLEDFLSSSIMDGTEDNRKKASEIIRHHSLLYSLEAVIDELNPEIKNLLIAINPEIFYFFHFCCLVRNVHIHNLGKTTQNFINKGKKYGSVREENIFDKSGNLIKTEYFSSHTGLAEKKIEIDKYISLGTLVAMFRVYTKMIADILDSSI